MYELKHLAALLNIALDLIHPISNVFILKTCDWVN